MLKKFILISLISGLYIINLNASESASSSAPKPKILTLNKTQLEKLKNAIAKSESKREQNVFLNAPTVKKLSDQQLAMRLRFLTERIIELEKQIKTNVSSFEEHDCPWNDEIFKKNDAIRFEILRLENQISNLLNGV
ncbi:MAG: hypothetical protein P4L22_05820 [Candidatus Babeliales bacterium]|nr:hypothetical protein [Candidatus Babeliales bacterium]